MIDVWWTIHGESLMNALVRVQQGESPDIVYMEMYANSDSDHYEA